MMDPALHELLRTAAPGEEAEVVMLVRRGHDPPPQVRVVARFGDVVTCRVAVDALIDVRGDPAVESLKASRTLAASDVYLVDDGGFDAGPRRPLGMRQRGAGAIVAAIDFGLDFAHPNFRHPDGSTRLLAFWDQRRPARAANPYGYGTIYTPAEIDRALREPDPYTALGYHPAEAELSPTLGSHGTHVVDIAAGNGSPSGVAPDAGLIFVHLAARNTPLIGGLGDSVRFLEAASFVAATAGDRPWSCNASVGRTGGDHTGRSLVERALDSLLEEQPGRCLTLSTGNYAARRQAAHGWIPPLGAANLDWIVHSGDPTPNELEVWYSGKDRFDVELIAPTGERTVAALDTIADVVVGGRVVGRLYHRALDPAAAGDHHVDCFLGVAAPSGTWKVVVRGMDVVDGRYHAWIERDARVRAQSAFDAASASPRYTLGSIATGFRTITVAAIDPATDEPAPFSSQGPTRDSRIRPDCAAPGVAILAARSTPRGAEPGSAGRVRMNGTSMAAPHVAGTVALMFAESSRPLRIEETRALLLGSCRRMRDGDPLRIGAGLLDIERAVAAAGAITTGARNAVATDLSITEQPMITRDDEIEELVGAADELVSQGRRVSADELLQAVLGRVASSVPPAAAWRVFRAVAGQGRNAAPRLPGVTVVARPGERFPDALQRGDIIVRKALGEGDATHVAVVAGPELKREELAAAGVIAEGAAPGWYAPVIEGGQRPRRLADRFARRVRDESRASTRDQVVLRPSSLEGSDDTEDTGDTAMSASELKKIEETSKWLEGELEKLDKERMMTTEDKELFIDGIRKDVKEARKLAGAPRTDRKRREEAKKLIELYARARKAPEQQRKSTEALRSLTGRRLFSQLEIQPPVIHVEDHEAARISFGFKTQPTKVAVWIMEKEQGQTTGFRQLVNITQPTDRYFTAVWEGLFGGSANQPPETGTYRVHITAGDATGDEEIVVLVRVENPKKKTVKPRAASESGEAVKALTFSGWLLTLEDVKGNAITVRAVSGLRANNPRNTEKRDYTRPSCQWAKDRGPIPAGKYVVKKNSVQMPTLKKVGGKDELHYASGAKAEVWGPFRAPLSPSGVCGREAFFIHVDVKDDGTAGCIGVHPDDVAQFNLMMKILIKSPADVPVEVVYPMDARSCWDKPLQCAGSTGGQGSQGEEGADEADATEDAIWAPALISSGESVAETVSEDCGCGTEADLQ